jgi:hypothetical protein
MLLPLRREKEKTTERDCETRERKEERDRRETETRE